MLLPVTTSVSTHAWSPQRSLSRPARAIRSRNASGCHKCRWTGGSERSRLCGPR